MTEETADALLHGLNEVLEWEKSYHEGFSDMCVKMADSIALEYSGKLMTMYEKSMVGNIFKRWMWKRRFKKMVKGIPKFFNSIEELKKIGNDKGTD